MSPLSAEVGVNFAHGSISARRQNAFRCSTARRGAHGRARIGAGQDTAADTSRTTRFARRFAEETETLARLDGTEKVNAISDAAEAYLQLLDADLSGELSNHAIFSEHVSYSSAKDARMATLRLAYLHGQHDATAPVKDFEADLRTLVNASQK